MTYEEQQQYNKLSSVLKEEYNHVKRKHPEWPHEKILGNAQMNIQLEDVVDNGGIDVTKIGSDGTIVIPPEIMKEILKGTKIVLTNLGIVLYSFFEAIDAAIDVLDNIIEAGINYIGDKLKEFWDWLTN